MCIRDRSAVPSPAPLQTAEARGFVQEEEALTQALLYRLRTASPDALAALYGMDEGLSLIHIYSRIDCLFLTATRENRSSRSS